jgi:uncharacterized protein (TIGR03083 family)
MSIQPTPDEIADRYAAAYQRVTTLAAEFGKDDLATPVPGTPKWTLHGLLSHMVGGPVAFTTGRLEGAGGPEWTQRQVDERVDHSLDQLLDEWAGVYPAIEGGARAGEIPPPLTFDILTHESDLRGALGLPHTPDPQGIRFITDGFGIRTVKVAAKAELPALQLIATDSDWQMGEAGGVTAKATEHEWTRALTGRRSDRQVSAYDWSDDPAPYLPHISLFGSLREDDVKE